MTISEWKKEFIDYLNSLNMPRDDYKGIISYIDEVPTMDSVPVSFIEERILIARMCGLSRCADDLRRLLNSWAERKEE